MFPALHIVHVCITNSILLAFNIRLSCTVWIPIFWLADLYHMILGCDITTTLQGSKLKKLLGCLLATTWRNIVASLYNQYNVQVPLVESDIVWYGLGHIHTISTFLVYPFLFNNVTKLHFSFRAGVPNLHVSPKTEIYLDFSIKKACFVFEVEICNFSVFGYNFYSFKKYIYTEKLKNARRKLLNSRNKKFKKLVITLFFTLLHSQKHYVIFSNSVLQENITRKQF